MTWTLRALTTPDSAVAMDAAAHANVAIQNLILTERGLFQTPVNSVVVGDIDASPALVSWCRL